MFRCFHWLGDQLRDNWVFDVDDEESLIRETGDQKRALWLLAAISRDIKHLLLLRRAELEQPNEEHPVSFMADAALIWALRSQGETLLADVEYGEGQVSVRACKAIKKASKTVDLVSDLNHELLISLPKCGERTAREILEWANSIQSKTPSLTSRQ